LRRVCAVARRSDGDEPLSDKMEALRGAVLAGDFGDIA
ncbi:MAG: hypothetical protein FD126_2965, partial [Elusimicrobia bacterium]